MALPIWTSTKNSEDRETENGFFTENSNTIIRIEAKKLDSIPASEFSLSKIFEGIISEVRLPEIWVSKHLPKMVEIAETSLDLKLRNVMLEFKGNVFSSYVMGTDRVIRAKIDLAIDQDTADAPAAPFKIIVAADMLSALNKFISKAFGFGPCIIAAKGGSPDNCESILVSVISKEEDVPEVHMESKLPRDEFESKTSQEDSFGKACLAKIPRSIGELPFNLINIPEEMHQKYSATIKPTLRWAFSNKQNYVELVSNAGVLEVQFKTEEGNNARASLGARIDTESELPPNPSIPLACVDGKYLYDIFSFAKETLKLTFGIIDTGGELTPSMLYLESEDVDAAVTQCYSKEDFKNKPTIYVTRIKGKIVESSQEVATERALRQNKAAGQAKAADTKPDKMADPFDETSSDTEVDEIGTSPEHADVVHKENTGKFSPVHASEEASVVFVDQNEESALIESANTCSGEASVGVELGTVASDGEESSELDKIGCSDKTLAAKDKEPVELTLNKIASLLVDAQKNMLALASDLDKISLKVASVMGTMTGQKISQSPAVVYDIDIIIKFLSQYEGSEVKMSQIRENLAHIRESSVYGAINKLEKLGLLERVKKGVYKVPESLEEKALVAFPRRKGRKFSE